MRYSCPWITPICDADAPNLNITPAWSQFFQGQQDIYNQVIKPLDGADPQNSTFGTIPLNPFVGQIVYLNAASGGSGEGIYYYKSTLAWVKLA